MSVARTESLPVEPASDDHLHGPSDVSVDLQWSAFLIFIQLMVTIGCGHSKAPQRQSAIYRPDLVDAVSLDINGQSVEDGKAVLNRLEPYHLTASYSRHVDARFEWNQILLLIVRTDDSGGPGEVSYKTLLGVRDQVQVRNAVATWECATFRGAKGKAFTVRLPEGFYSLQLCWERKPTTVDEKIQFVEDPGPYRTVFFKRPIEIR